MASLFLTIFLTLLISATCSLLEAIVFSINDIELEDLRSISKRSANFLAKCKANIDETSSAILMVNTFANTFGAIVAGGLVSKIFGEHLLIYFSIGLTLAILIFSEIFPKNIGFIYRKKLYRPAALLLKFIVRLMYPFSKTCRMLVRLFIGNITSNSQYSDRDIVLLAEKNVRDGTLSKRELKIIENTLKMDYTIVSQIMTPLEDLTAFSKNMTVKDVFIANNDDLPTGRIPVFNNNHENLVGIVHRRKILHALATNKTNIQLGQIMDHPISIDHDVFVDDALTILIKKMTQLAFVKKDNQTIGVLTLDDIFEHIIGVEIAENDDIAVKVSVQNVAKRKAKFKTDD